MSEAGQSKRLIVLDAEFQQVEEIPIDLGPRHFYLEGTDPVMPHGLRPCDRYANAESGCDVMNPTPAC